MRGQKQLADFVYDKLEGSLATRYFLVERDPENNQRKFSYTITNYRYSAKENAVTIKIDFDRSEKDCGLRCTWLYPKQQSVKLENISDYKKWAKSCTDSLREFKYNGEVQEDLRKLLLGK